MDAVVEFEYTAEQEDELTLKVGDIITDVKTSDGGWWEGELRGKKGLFPENFVQLVKRREPASLETKREAPQRKSVRELANKFKDMSVGGPPKKKDKQKRCKVLFEYKKENDDELELAVGEILDFHKEVEDGWWEGSLNGKVGVFPSNFVEMLEETPSPGESLAPVVEDKDKDKQAGDTQGKDSDFHTIKGKKVVGVGLGNIFGGGPIKLRAVTDSGKKEDSAKSPPQGTPESVPETAVREKTTIERAVVRFSYVAEQPDELSLVEGQIVRILERELEDEGWWKGEVNGKIGVFPDNFVELLPNEKINKPPQKPPPPAVAAAATTKNSLPKLPDKPPASDVVDAKTESQSPSLGKKPQVPLPTIKKPVNQKSTELKPEPSIQLQAVSSAKDKPTVRENHTENHNTQGTIHFDDIEPASQKLTHLTYGRAQGPKKRPPSSVLILNDGEKDDIAEQKNNNHLPTTDKQPSRLPDKLDTEKPPSRLTDKPDTEKPHSRLQDRTDTEKPHSRLPDRPDKPLPVLPAKDYRSPQPAHPVENTAVITHSSAVTSLRDKELHLNTPPPRPPEPTKAPPSSQNALASSVQMNKLLEQLQHELADLKTNSVSKSAFMELRVQHEKLKVEFESLKKIHSSKIRDLANEVDEEKKLRLSTQVEIERVKKLLAETHV
ncbi:hypothetical protein BsWGS_28375 [Bradybaena similaris]